MTYAVMDGRLHKIGVEFDDRHVGWWFRMESLGIEFMAWPTSGGVDPDDGSGPHFLCAEVSCSASAWPEQYITMRLGDSGTVTEDLFASMTLKALRAAYPDVFAGFVGTVEKPAGAA